MLSKAPTEDRLERNVSTGHSRRFCPTCNEWVGEPSVHVTGPQWVRFHTGHCPRCETNLVTQPPSKKEVERAVPPIDTEHAALQRKTLVPEELVRQVLLEGERVVYQARDRHPPAWYGIPNHVITNKRLLTLNAVEKGRRGMSAATFSLELADIQSTMPRAHLKEVEVRLKPGCAVVQTPIQLWVEDDATAIELSDALSKSIRNPDLIVDSILDADETVIHKSEYYIRDISPPIFSGVQRETKTVSGLPLISGTETTVRQCIDEPSA
jgi:hypothetical protein